VSDDSAAVLARTLPLTQIKEVLLSHNQISDGGTKELATALPASSVTLLDLSSNKITSRGLSCFIPVLLHPDTKLLTLNLEDNELLSTRDVVDVFVPVIVKNTVLTGLTLPLSKNLSADMRAIISQATLRNVLIREKLQLEEASAGTIEAASYSSSTSLSTTTPLSSEQLAIRLSHTLTALSAHNHLLEDSFASLLELLSGQLSKETGKKVDYERMKARRRCENARDELEKEQSAKHKVESMMMVVKQENIGLLDVLKLQRQEIAANKEEVLLLKKRLTNQRKRYRQKLGRGEIKAEEDSVEEELENGEENNNNEDVNKESDARKHHKNKDNNRNNREKDNEIARLSLKTAEQENLISKLLVENEELAQRVRFLSFLDEENPNNHNSQNKNDKHDAIACSICRDKVKCVAFIPCGHMCSCEDCSVTLTECPVCRTVATVKCKIFT